MIFPFGPHKDKEIKDIPTSYLEWCQENLILSDKLQVEIELQLKNRFEKGNQEK